MGSLSGAEYDTSKLREYARHLSTESALVGNAGRLLRAGHVPGHVWGVSAIPPALIGNPSASDPAADMYEEPLRAGEDAAPELSKFRRTYELAHAVSVERVDQLEQAYAAAATMLSRTADHYDRIEGRDPPPDTLGDASALAQQQPPGARVELGDSTGVEAGDRIQIWQTYYGKAVRDALMETGFGTYLPLFDAYLGVNTEQLKRISLLVYGSTDTYGIDNFEHRSGDTKPHPDHFEYSNTYAPWILDQIATRTKERVRDVVKIHWTGGAYDAFEKYIDKLVKITRDESFRLRTLGDSLYDVAVAIELSQEDMENHIAGAAEKLLTGIGTARDLKRAIDPFEIGITVTTQALQAYSKAETKNAREARKAETQTENTYSLREMVIAAPPADEALPELPDPFDEWEAR